MFNAHIDANLELSKNSQHRGREAAQVCSDGREPVVIVSLSHSAAQRRWWNPRDLFHRRLRGSPSGIYLSFGGLTPAATFLGPFRAVRRIDFNSF